MAISGGDRDRKHHTPLHIGRAGRQVERQLPVGAGRVLVEDLGAEAVPLGGTELSLGFAGRDPDLPDAEPGAGEKRIGQSAHNWSVASTH